MKNILTVIIPTWNNDQYLFPCILSIKRTGILDGFAKVIVINNGDRSLKADFENINGVQVIDTGKNLGWEGGLVEGLKHADTPFVCFQNDDTYIPPSQVNFYERMISRFQDKSVGAVGPTTTNAAGWHSIYRQDTPTARIEVPFLIFFTVMLRRETLDEVGGIDTTLPGGDDIDLSIRLRKAGKKLLIDPSAFIIHHGFKTGERVHGGPEVAGGWNSPQMTQETNTALIRKHGFKEFFSTVYGQSEIHGGKSIFGVDEHEIIQKEIDATGLKVIELGCGARKAFHHSMGVDQIPKGKEIPNLNGAISVGDVVADVSQPLPFNDGEFDVVISQHIIEHCVDLVKMLKEWSRILRPGGLMVISTPNEDITKGITLNPEHCHAFSPESLANLMELLWFKEEKAIDPCNGMSFISIFKKGNDFQLDRLYEGGITKEVSNV